MDDLQTQTKGLSMADYETFKLGDWKLQCGATLSDAHIAYRTFGDPKSPAIVYPTWYSGGMCPECHALLIANERLQQYQTMSGS